MLSRRSELAEFKSHINLAAFAVERYGFVLSRGSSRNSLSLKHPDGTKILVSRGRDGRWLFRTVSGGGSGARAGSIIDLVQSRGGGHLGEVRQLLRSYLGRPLDLDLPSPRPVVRDRAAVVAEYEGMRSVAVPRYLAEGRCIPANVLSSTALVDTFRMDRRGNVAFPHHNADGALTGYELVNHGFKGFSPGGRKGVWSSRSTGADSVVVAAESPIDAMSYLALHAVSGMRVLSIGGQMSDRQVGLLRLVISTSPATTFIAATDADDAGREMAEAIGGLFREIRPAECTFRYEPPPPPNKDWNDVLRATSGKRTPVPESTPVDGPSCG